MCFKKEYTPPNIFPGKKFNSKKVYSPPKSFFEGEYYHKHHSREESPLKVNIMKKLSVVDQRGSNKNFKRSVSQFEKKRSQLIFGEKLENARNEGLIKGKKMVLHKD